MQGLDAKRSRHLRGAAWVDSVEVAVVLLVVVQVQAARRDGGDCRGGKAHASAQATTMHYGGLYVLN